MNVLVTGTKDGKIAFEQYPQEKYPT